MNVPAFTQGIESFFRDMVSTTTSGAFGVKEIDRAFRACVRTALVMIPVPQGRLRILRIAQDVSPGYTPPTTISPEGTADNHPG
jgi:hypothetical protein